MAFVEVVPWYRAWGVFSEKLVRILVSIRLSLFPLRQSRDIVTSERPSKAHGARVFWTFRPFSYSSQADWICWSFSLARHSWFTGSRFVRLQLSPMMANNISDGAHGLELFSVILQNDGLLKTCTDLQREVRAVFVEPSLQFW